MATVTSQSAYTLHGSGTVADSNVREDLANTIFNVTPYKTPFFSSIPKTKATNDNHEWLTDTLRASVSNNENVEAEVISGTAPGIRTRKGNYIQIAQEEATVTKKAEMMDKAGVPGKEMAYQLMKKGKELQMDVEKQLLSIQAKVAPTNSTAGRSGTVAAYINTNESVSGTGGTANSASTGSTVPTPGTNEAISEATFTGLIDDVWENSGDLDGHVVLANAAVIAKVRGFGGIVDSFDAAASEGTIYNRITVYQSQFGPVKVVADKHMQANTLYIIDPSTWGLAFAGGKAIHTTDIATQAAAETKLLEMYYTLEARSEEANAGYYAITE